MLCLVFHSCILSKLSGKTSDLKLFKNVIAMFIFKIRLVYQFNEVDVIYLLFKSSKN